MKKLLSALLTLALCLSMVGTVFAAELSFTDVSTSDWFYNDVKSAVALGLINGKSATSYAPNDNLTYAEAIKLAACMHQLYTEDEISLVAVGTPWYTTYVDYCMDNGIIDREYAYTDNATRAGYMGIFANALPEEGLKAINNVPDDSIPDVPSSKAYAPGVYKLYRAGILTGVDAEHNCNPLANIKRSEVAAILTRMMNENKRVEFSMGAEEAAEALEITKEPKSVKVQEGEEVTLSVAVEGGTEPYTYQWQISVMANKKEVFQNISDNDSVEGAETAELTLNTTGAITNEFRCVITDANEESVTTQTAKVTVNKALPLAIKTQPGSKTAEPGTTVEFSVEVEGGKEPYTYQWMHEVGGAKKQVVPIPNETAATIVRTAPSENGSTKCHCVITDANGDTVTSEEAVLTGKESTGGVKDKFQQAEETEPLTKEDFLLYVEDVFTISGRGVVVNGRVVSGMIEKGDAITIVAQDGTKKQATVAGIEMFRKSLDEAEKGDNIGLNFSAEIEKDMVQRGDCVVSETTSYRVYNKVKGTLKLTATADGGRSTAISEGATPQFYRAGADFTGKITGLANGTMNPGETQENISVEFPTHHGMLYVGQELSVREGGRTIGTFTITTLATSGGRVTLPDTSRDSGTAESDTTSIGRIVVPVGKGKYME